jgi:choline dehydrogenase-like flavoprotein
LENGSIIGVEFIHLGKLYPIKTKKEVMLKARAFKTPQILELSVIGNPDILYKASIKRQVENHRDGENLHDHPALGVGFELVDGEQSMDVLGDPTLLKILGRIHRSQDRAILERRFSNRLRLLR